jgi:hypothetical protein
VEVAPVIASIRSCHTAPDNNPLHAAFLALLPKFETHARICFRSIPCPARRADRVAETLGLAWKWYQRLAERGKDVSRFPMAFIAFVAQAVKRGRRVCGQERPHEVFSPVAQQWHDFAVEALPACTRRSPESLYGLVHGQQDLDAYEERLQDNHVTPPPDAAAFRIDFPQFLAGLSDRDRQLAMFLSLGHRASQAATKFQLTPGRVTQLRQRWCQAWYSGHGEQAPSAARAQGRAAGA